MIPLKGIETIEALKATIRVSKKDRSITCHMIGVFDFSIHVDISQLKILREFDIPKTRSKFW